MREGKEIKMKFRMAGIFIVIVSALIACSGEQTKSTSDASSKLEPKIDGKISDKPDMKPAAKMEANSSENQEMKKADAGVVLATIGDKQITNADLEKKLEEIPTYARANFLTKEGKMKLLDRLIRNELLIRAAEAAGYDKRPEIQAKIDDARERILTSEYFKNEMSQATTSSDKELLDYYNGHKAEYKKDESVDARHILLDSESEAKSIRQKIIGGEIAFEKAAAEYSKDIETKNDGGKLGKIVKGGAIKGIGKSSEFDEKIFALKSGDISEPISTKRGFEIVKVDSKEEGGYKPFDEVKQQISEESQVKDADILKEYQGNPEEYKTKARVKIKHIQVATEAKAKEIEKKLKNGAEFDQLVETDSTDQASVKQKGSLGYLYKDGYIRGIGKDPDFEKAVFALKEGETSGPIQSKKGWHVVKIEEKTEEALKPLEEVKSQIRSKLLRDAKDKGMDNKFDELKKKYSCTVYEDRVTGSSENPQAQKDE
jgi:peptidyl-prolyl cis-trans isomerase C